MADHGHSRRRRGRHPRADPHAGRHHRRRGNPAGSNTTNASPISVAGVTGASANPNGREHGQPSGSPSRQSGAKRPRPTADSSNTHRQASRPLANPWNNPRADSSSQRPSYRQQTGTHTHLTTLAYRTPAADSQAGTNQDPDADTSTDADTRADVNQSSQASYADASTNTDTRTNADRKTHAHPGTDTDTDTPTSVDRLRGQHLLPDTMPQQLGEERIRVRRPVLSRQQRELGGRRVQHRPLLRTPRYRQAAEPA